MIVLDRVLNKDPFRDPEEHIATRVVYWAAFYGKLSVVQNYIEVLKSSPFIRSYHDQDILTGAVRG